MNPSERDRLLREIFDDESVARVRAESLATGLQAVRRRRQRRKVGAGAAACAVSALLIVASLARRGDRGVVAPTSTEHSPALAVPPPPALKWISDEQLLARFPDRGVALIGAAGDQTLVFLDSDTRKR